MLDIVIPGMLTATACALLWFAVVAMNTRRMAVAAVPCRDFVPVGLSESSIPENCAARIVATPSSSTSRPWQSVTVSRLADAELLLDRLENCGIAERELSATDDASFVIRWR